MKTKVIVDEWISKKWHKEHRWHTGTGKFIKRMLNKKLRAQYKNNLS
jgi:hypothetical protein